MAALDSPEQHLETSIVTCVSCGSALAGSFCSKCGEKNAAIRHYDVRHFLAESLEHLTHIDNTFLKSLRLLLFRPGALTELFMSGQRKKYLGPLQLFLVMNLVFFFAQSFFWTGPFSVPLEVQMNALPFKGLVRKMVEDKAALRMHEIKSADAGAIRQEIQREFDHYEQTAAKSLVIIMAPMFAAILGLLELGRKRFAVEHLVFSLHFYSFLMGLFSMMLAGFAIFFVRTSHPGDETPIVAALLLIISIYLYFGLRRAYQETRWAALAKAGFLTVGVALVLQAYRLILVVNVLHSI